MSIINDALKKTQSAFSKHNNISPTPNEVLVSRHRTPIHIHYKRTLFFTITAGILTFCVLTWHTFLLSLFHTRPASVKQVILPPQKTMIILNGTLQNDHTRVALINHRLYYVGDLIDGYQIKQINYNDVVLLNPNTHNTRLITLSLHS